MNNNSPNEYIKDHYKLLIDQELKYMPKWNYMVYQPNITFTMRSILVDWIVDVSEVFKLKNETIYLTISYVDR